MRTRPVLMWEEEIVERLKGYAPIGSYGLLGDGHGAALVASDGTIDWLAVPEVETPPLLGALLDAERGGRLALAPIDGYEASRRYLPGTMVLETVFKTPNGTLVVHDAMTVGHRGRLPWSEIARVVEVREGTVRVRFSFEPGDRFARRRPWGHGRDGVPLVLDGELLCALVTENLGEVRIAPDRLSGEATLVPGTPALLALVASDRGPLYVPSASEVHQRVKHTIASWRSWSERIGYDGPHAEAVRRSALVLKALQNTTTGALVAAPTTSLPEVIGGKRNFDYRYGWVRDSSFMLDALARLGLSEELDSSLDWLLAGLRRTAPDVHVFYTVQAEPASGEQTELAHYAGYRDSKPVMLGNKAAQQTQHGAYGDVLEAVARFVSHGGRLDTETGLLLAALVDAACDEWRRPGAGIWELGEERLYTSSLINCWAAFDRAVDLAERGEIPCVHVERWRHEREEVRRFVNEQCWSKAKGAYTFYAGTDDLDASVLLAARTRFLSGDDRRLWGTIDAIRRELTAEGPLLYRYSGAGEQEHAFICCSFWMVEALAHAGRTQEAGELLSGMIERANDLGLLSEEIDETTGELLGNFPLGLSHLALVGATTAYATAMEKDASRKAA